MIRRQVEVKGQDAEDRHDGGKRHHKENEHVKGNEHAKKRRQRGARGGMIKRGLGERSFYMRQR